MQRLLDRLFYPLCSLNYLYTCPVCGKRVKDFLYLSDYFTKNLRRYGHPYGLEDYETLNFSQYGCPHCGATDRDRLYALYFVKKLILLPKDKTVSILDIAPSPLRPVLLKEKRVRYRCADLLRSDVDDNVDVMDMHIYEDNSFDVFICSHVLEHVEDDKIALSELFRILKPGGWGILMVPINLVNTIVDEDPTIKDAAERWRRFGQFDHIRLYSKQGFVQRVKETGFLVYQLGIDFFGNATFQRNGISPKSVLYVVEKR